MPVSPQEFDNWVIRATTRYGYKLIGTGIKPAEHKYWSIAYLFEHQQGGTTEFPKYYVWEVPSVPGNSRHVSKMASQTADRNNVEYHGKLPAGSCRGDNAPWDGNPQEDAGADNPVVCLAQCATEVWEACVQRRLDVAPQFLPSLIYQSLMVFGASGRFFGIMTSLDAARVGLEGNDLRKAKDELHCVVTTCGMLRRDLQPMCRADGDGDNEFEEDDLIDEIIDQGEIVFSHDWDSGGPGAGAGAEQVFHRNGKFAISSLDFGNVGPFTSLDQALREKDLLTVTDATTSISSTMLPSKDIATRLQSNVESIQILINGEPWVYRAKANQFKPIRAKK